MYVAQRVDLESIIQGSASQLFKLLWLGGQTGWRGARVRDVSHRFAATTKTDSNLLSAGKQHV